MTGAEHYQAAERLLSRALHVKSLDDRSPMNPAEAAHCLAAAQVHATLALSAATALNVPGGEDAGMYIPDVEEWEAVASARRKVDVT
jgi:hypothetical protein